MSASECLQLLVAEEEKSAGPLVDQARRCPRSLCGLMIE